MAFDLTGASLSSYLLKIIRDIVNRSPRFRSALGEISLVSNNMVAWNNVQVVIKDLSSDGVRLSPDYFMATMLGRAIVTKVSDKEGSFIEWANEIDASQTLLDPGVYYFNLDSVDESTKDIGLTIQKFRWVQGSVKDAEGTRIGFRNGIDATTVTPSDPTNSSALTFQAAAGYIYLLSPVHSLVVHDSAGNSLTPNIDYWVERNVTQVIIESTQFGMQDVPLPSGYESFTITNQDGYTLRPNLDYILTLGATGVLARLSAWTPSGQTLSVSGLMHLDPSVPANLINPENILNFEVGPNESLVADQVFISTQAADHIQVTPNIDGTISLPTWLPPGGYCTYEARIQTPCYTVQGKKNSINPNFIPGLWVAIGDRTQVGDQMAIIASPVPTQTYNVYGSKDSVRFTLDMKANDPSTASELAELVKDALLIFRRQGMESDGLTIYEAARSSVSSQRDNSGTAPTFTYSLSVTGSADWRVFVPLITRLTSVDVYPTPYTPTQFRGQICASPRYTSLGYGKFIPEYR